MEKYDRQMMFRYLLGDLDSFEEEFFDELSITDDDFADTLAATEFDLIDSHVRVDLNEKYAALFEKNYLASPRRREKKDFAHALRVFAETNAGQGISGKASAGFFSSLGSLFGSNRLQLGFAIAGVLVLGFAGWWFFASRQTATPETAAQKTPSPVSPTRNTGLENTNETTVLPEKSVDPQANVNPPVNKKSLDPTNKETTANTPSAVPQLHVATLILSPPLRGGGQVTSLPISKEITVVAVTLQLDANEFPSYRVALTNEGGKNISRSGLLRMHGNSLNLRFPARIFRPGVYSLAVSGIKNGEAEIISSYSFRPVIR